MPLSKLTILVGENSSGKTTLLAATRLAWDVMALGEPKFNESPFVLGSYDSIAHYHGGRGKRVAKFLVGGSVRIPQVQKGRQRDEISFRVGFRRLRGQPVIDSWFVAQGSRKWSINTSDNTGIFTNGTASVEVGLDNEYKSLDRLPLQFVRQQLGFRLFGQQQEPSLLTKEDREWIRDLTFGVLHAGLGRPRAVAPIRTHPQRTYDTITDEPTPEGEHVPALLSRYHAEKSPEWSVLEPELQRFGQHSGMFRQLEVRHLGQIAETGPFQLEFQMPSQQGKRNILDVGYGVSQILPVVVECMMPSNEPLLLQQPEVHLHPRAQAELGTFLANIAKSRHRQILVETHSDYIIDRIGMAVRSGGLQPADVAVVFFETESGVTNVHSMGFDSQGSLIDPPDSYRSFFLNEHAKVLGLQK